MVNKTEREAGEGELVLFVLNKMFLLANRLSFAAGRDIKSCFISTDPQKVFKQKKHIHLQNIRRKYRQIVTDKLLNIQLSHDDSSWEMVGSTLCFLPQFTQVDSCIFIADTLGRTQACACTHTQACSPFLENLAAGGQHSPPRNNPRMVKWVGRSWGSFRNGFWRVSAIASNAAPTKSVKISRTDS